MNFGITNVVRILHVGPSVRSLRIGMPLSVWVLSLFLSGCGLFSSRDGLGTGYYLPLTAQLRQAPSVAAAHLAYQDACGQPQTLAIGGPLAEAIARKSGLVFEKVVTGGAGAAVDGYQDVAVGMSNIDMAIVRKVTKSYPATVAIGLDFSYTTAEGNLLFSKKLQSLGRGEVDVNEASCEVKGLDKIVQEAIANVTDGMAKQLGTSSKIVETAKARKAGTAPSAVAGAVAPPVPVAGSSATAGTAAAVSQAVEPQVSAASGEAASLVFRAIIRDENRNQLVHAGETISVELEVQNQGPSPASGVEVLVAGTPELIEQIPGIVPVGDIAPGDVKRVSLEGKIGAVKEPIQAELMLTLRTGSATDQLPSAKKFLVAMKPGTSADATAIPLDVDELPKRAGKLKQPRAVGVAIGIGQFRENGVQRVKYAARDAETMANYWQAVVGVPPERVRRLIDARALKSDVAEAFEEWLPKQVDVATVVYVYVSGRGLVESSTGAVFIVPFDGALSSVTRVFSLRRLHEALARLPIQRAIVMLDLSLEAVAKKEGGEPAAPQWEQDGQAKDKVMWMIGNRAIQDAHHYDLGQHGLFTYELLKGLAGAADVDKDGTILAGELCAYAKGQVISTAREQFGNEQEPVCIPAPGQGATVRLQPLAKLK